MERADLRALMAAQILAGIASNDTFMRAALNVQPQGQEASSTRPVLAYAAVAYTDELLKALER